MRSRQRGCEKRVGERDEERAKEGTKEREGVGDREKRERESGECRHRSPDDRVNKKAP